DSRRIRFRRLDVVPALWFLEGLDRACLIEMKDSVELLRHVGQEVMAHALSIRPVDHADRAFESRLRHERGRSGAVSKVEEEARDPGIVETKLVAVRQCRAHPFLFTG